MAKANTNLAYHILEDFAYDLVRRLGINGATEIIEFVVSKEYTFDSATIPLYLEAPSGQKSVINKDCIKIH